MSKFDYEIICYRVMFFDTYLDKWAEVDFSTEEKAIEILKICIACNYRCKMLKICGLVGDLNV